MILRHPTWCIVVSKHTFQRKECFSSIRTPKKKFCEFCDKTKFQLQNAFFSFFYFTSLKKTFERAIENRHLFQFSFSGTTHLRDQSLGLYLTFCQTDFSWKAPFWKKLFFLSPYITKTSKSSQNCLENAWKNVQKVKNIFFFQNVSNSS